MQWQRFLTNRLELNLSFLEYLLIDDEYRKHFISADNEEKIRSEILKILNTNYNDLELYDLKNKLEIVIMLKEFHKNKSLIAKDQEQDLVLKLIKTENYILLEEQSIQGRIINLATLQDVGLMEIGFRDLRRDYQSLFLYKILKKEILKALKSLNSPLAQLAYIFSDF